MTASNRLRGRPRESGEKAAQNTIQSLDRALEILDLVAESSGLSLSEIATALDQSPSTVYRVLTTLEARQVVEVDPVAQVWHIGAAAFRLGSSFLRRSSVVERSRPFMRDLMRSTGETANLGIEKSHRVLFVSQVESGETIRAFFPPGTQAAMHSSGIGKASVTVNVPVLGSGSVVNSLIPAEYSLPLGTLTTASTFDNSCSLGWLT